MDTLEEGGFACLCLLDEFLRVQLLTVHVDFKIRSDRRAKSYDLSMLGFTWKHAVRPDCKIEVMDCSLRL